MHSISESIETIGSIIYELSVDENKIAKFREQYQKISLRSRDTNFYLSAIGGFSSGKSTLINTIIKRKLLKVATAATTAVPTYISKGKNNRVVVSVKCDDGKKYNLTSETDISKFEKKFGIQLSQQIDERISLLTTDKELSLKIKEVNIELPDDELANGLCIIDTPGINPGADFAEGHAEITKYILNEKADAIIILFPADQAYTQSFEKFLKDNAEYFMKDAIFVVTMMDRVDEEEWDDVIRFVKTNLRSNFHLKDPQVLSCSAMLSGKVPYWTSKFKEFEQSLMDKLAQNRQRIVTERLIKLSNELLNSIQSEILSQKNDFEKRLSVLQNCLVANLIFVLEDCKVAAIYELSKIQIEHNTAVKNESANLENKIMEKVNSELNACDTRSGVTKYVRNFLTSDIEGACKEIYATSTQHTQNLNKALASAISGMIEKVKIYYGEIGSVIPQNILLSTSEHQTAIEDKLTGLSGMNCDYEGKIDVTTAIGGDESDAIILTKLRTIGGAIGEVSALIGGDRLFVDSIRSKVRKSVSGKLPEISKSVVQELCNGMQTNYSKAREVLEAKKDELISQYKLVYEPLERQFNSEKEEITRQLQHSEKIQNRIKDVLQQINEIQGEITG